MIMLMGITGCDTFLDEKPDKKLVEPTSIEDLQGLLDYYSRVNYYEPSAAESSADDYYLTDADWAGLTKEYYRRMYTWEEDNLFDTGFGDWSYCYDNVYRANTVLDNLDKISAGTASVADINNLRGQALALRARAFMKAAFIWAPAFDESSSAAELGIPLRLSSDFNTPTKRSNVQETYNQIVADLKQAIPLLPVSQVHVMRTSRPAAFALLARCYLAMRNYEAAEKYADSCLQIHHSLLDYNTLSTSASYPVKQFNLEVILETRMLTPSSLGNNKAKIDSSLYKSYKDGDLRKQVFFRNNNNGTYGFKGSYEGGANLFDGIATDEVLLIRAECLARNGKVDEAMSDLNLLLTSRWNKTKPFVPVTASGQTDAVSIILGERRKELLMRGLRWQDIKRLNKEGAGIDLARNVNGKRHVLPAGDLRFALPIPEDVIAISGIEQNPRE